jgi:hypothetical protein
MTSIDNEIQTIIQSPELGSTRITPAAVQPLSSAHSEPVDVNTEKEAEREESSAKKRRTLKKDLC